MDDKNQTLYDQLRDVLAAPGRHLRTEDDEAKQIINFLESQE